jgi:hypothetical protein
MPSKNALRTTATTALSRIPDSRSGFRFSGRLQEICRGDQGEADRNHDREQPEAIIFEVDGSENSRTRGNHAKHHDATATPN